ncbi:TPA: hypothetical protein ACH3X2_004868 [Trebouxia sp. C0005]
MCTGLQNQQHQGHMTTERDDSNSLDLAQQNKDCLQPCLSDLSKEDLQELWNFTQAFPCLQNYQPADQLSGCESEVQQQQLSYLAQLLQDKASRGHALPDQALSHVTIDSQPADRNNPSAGSDSLHGMHCGSNNSREAGADLQVSQASGLPGITDAHSESQSADMQQRPHAYSGLHHAGQQFHTYHQGHAGGRGVGLWAFDSGNHHGSSHDWRTQANQFPKGSSHCVVHESANGAPGFQPQANHKSDYSHSSRRVGPSCLGFGAKPKKQNRMQYCQQLQKHTQLLAPCCKPQTSPQVTHSMHDPRHSPQLHHLAGPHQGRALQPDRSPHQATSLFLGQAPGQSPALQQGLHQTWVPQQDMSNQHRPQQGKSAQQGPQQARVASSGPQPQRSSRRLGQKRKEALLASKCSPDDAIQYPPAVNADAYGHEPDSLAVGGSGVSCTAGLAAKYLGEAAHMTGPIRKRDHLGEAARVAEPAYSQSCSLTPARPLGGPVMTLPGPVIMAISRGRDDSMCISRQSHGRRFSPESSVGISVEVDLLADPSDMLGLSPDRPEVLDDFDDAQHYVARFQEDLPADPMEGLAIPSWHELLDEAATQLTPQGFPRTGPALASERFDPNSPASGTSPGQGFSGPISALTDTPALKRQKQSIMQETCRQPSWILDLDTKPTSSGVDLNSTLPCVSKAFKLPERMAIPSSQRSMPRSEAQGSDPQTQDRRSPSRSVEAITEGQASQQAQHKTKPAASQAGKGGKAKRAATGRKGYTAAAGPGRVQGQGQTVGANGKACTASLGTVLPFNTLKGTTVEGDLAELNTRIQATCIVPSKTAVALPVYPPGGRPQQSLHSEGLVAPLAIPEYCQLRPGSHEKQDAVHADSCGSGAQTDTMGGTSIRSGARLAGGGCVQLVKLSGTTSVGVRD